MKKLYNVFKNLINPVKQTTQGAAFFKNVVGKDAHTNNSHRAEVIDRIHALDRIIVGGSDKQILFSRVREMVYRSKLGNPLSQDVVDACEIVHHALLNDNPVLVKNVLILLPELNLGNQKIINEQDYENWVKNGRSDKFNSQSEKIEIIIDNLNDYDKMNQDHKQQQWGRRRK